MIGLLFTKMAKNSGRAALGHVGSGWGDRKRHRASVQFGKCLFRMPTRYPSGDVKWEVGNMLWGLGQTSNLGVEYVVIRP